LCFEAKFFFSYDDKFALSFSKSSNSTSNYKVEFGGILGGDPAEP